jgi:hypothetical protein
MGEIIKLLEEIAEGKTIGPVVRLIFNVIFSDSVS